ncbi:MAG: hypothetical protein ACO38W_04740, partial [Phycisphaerales bacterium]
AARADVLAAVRPDDLAAVRPDEDIRGGESPPIRTGIGIWFGEDHAERAGSPRGRLVQPPMVAAADVNSTPQGPRRRIPATTTSGGSRLAA